MIAVRWLGAFGNPRFRPQTTKGLQKCLEYEIGTNKEVSFSLQDAHTQLGQAQIGLLVNLEKSSIVAVYANDAWTEEIQDSGNLVATRSKRIARTIAEYSFEKSYSDSHEYDEGFGRLTYSGIVVLYSANKKVRNSARIVAKRLGLQYLGTLKEGMN